MSEEDAKMCSRIAPDYEVDENGLLFSVLECRGRRKIEQR